ncbi:MAG TPA: twin-arginine translocase subunit TatC [Candidatus Binataceae bacterium]|nr:twin-arginine translocase subunit TatC [Candidatus Binataceae bacterium]
MATQDLTTPQAYPTAASAPANIDAPAAAPESGPGPPGAEGAALGRMSLIEHLQELRVRLIWSAVALLAGFLVAYAIADPLFAALTWPIRAVSHGKLLLIGTGVGEAFFTKIKVALIAGLFIASPAVFYQIWKFIAPGLYQSERRMALPFIVSATLFFILGGYFCWAVVFRIGYAFFLSEYASIGITPTIRISEYLAFSSKLLLAFGITFEMPIFAFFLTRLGLIDHHLMIHHFRYAILVIFIVSAILTPPDMVSQFLLAIPLLGLYGLSIGVAYVFRTPDAAAAAALPAGAANPD